MKIHALALSLSLACAACIAQASPTQCENKAFTVQFLGSGGPISDDARASSATLIWLKGKPLALIDAGGGAFLRFGQSGARLEDVRFIGLTHFHTDHVSDLPALLKGSYFFNSPHQIDIAGPSGGAGFPSLSGFMNAQFNAKTGAYAYLSGLYSGKGDIPLKLNLKTVDYAKAERSTVYRHGGVSISALGIPHGDVPTLAYRIDAPEGSIVISADQNGGNPRFVDFAKNADILVMPLAIDEQADAASAFLHAKPSTVGRIAAAAKPKQLVLNHFMGKGLRVKDASLAVVRRYYAGPVYAGRDLSCFTAR
ncbi:MBL fold metallo-hydrolase [Chromobacterium sp. IIBBL 290-4]|uniref:MBL fold metallo-hydrolase n=1 Tax=Chromobacterium sp. IIBBL 290-4 TaxID=2953890 RepID=UPI0020B8FF4C|nr:MBL fold metallo-hydrolase [Chromobacterium sp. IIBBL 290-4]UTH73516.1 MBL fold metallo-hydrolase [Chromobacterium sp. IIBBL 290-4]